jgi:hypothetical protein
LVEGYLRYQYLNSWHGSLVLQEIKQGFLAGKQAEVVVDNIKRLTKDSEAPKLSVYKPLATPMGLVSLGRYEGVLQLPIVTLIGRLPGMIKSGDLFVGKSRAALGV